MLSHPEVSIIHCSSVRPPIQGPPILLLTPCIEPHITFVRQKIIPNCTRRKNILLTVPQFFHCRDEAGCQKTRLVGSSLPSLPRSAVLMLWLVLGGCSLASSLEGYLKTAWNEINKQLTGGKCWLVSLCCHDPEEETSFPVAAAEELQSIH